MMQAIAKRVDYEFLLLGIELNGLSATLLWSFGNNADRL